MKHLYEIGESIILKFYEHTKKHLLDDEAELFPALKLVISGIVETCQDREKKEEIETHLKEFIKEQYCIMWIEFALENGNSPNVKEEKEDALKTFDELYNGK